ncbi:MAG: hypothetical protein WCQ95_07235 [Bacteroidota bacterium]
MKENPEQVDAIFKKALDGFEESPPAGVKNKIFTALVAANTSRILKNTFIGVVLLISISGLAFLTVNSLNSPASNNATPTQQLKGYANQRQVLAETHFTQPDKLKHQNGKTEIKSGENASTTNTTVLNANKKRTENIPTNQKIEISSKNFNAIKFDDEVKTQPETIVPVALSNSRVIADAGFGLQRTASLAQIRQQAPLQCMQRLCFAYDEPKNLELVAQKYADHYKLPLLWSVAVYGEHSLYQTNCIRLAKRMDDLQPEVSAKMGFPSGSLGLNVKAEMKYFFFDFGVQYTHLTEKFVANQINYNAHNLQSIALAGQNMTIDTMGGYYHYYYMADTIVRLIDSVWTWKTDTSLMNLYDTTYKKVYDTLRNASWRNSYSFIEIPLAFGWQKNFGRLAIGVKTGPIVSMLVATKGHIPYAVVASPSLVAVSDEFKKYRLGMSWQIAALCNYQLNYRMLLELAPYYRFNLVGIKSAASGNKLLNNSFGIQLGVRYYF